MTPLAALLALFALLGGAAVLAVWLRRGASRITRGDGTERIRPGDLGVESWGPRGAVVQFSTEYCARCPGTRRVLERLTEQERGVRYVHIDVTGRPEFVARYRLRQTPTVLVLDGRGVSRARLSGTIDRNEVARVITAPAEGSAS